MTRIVTKKSIESGIATKLSDIRSTSLVKKYRYGQESYFQESFACLEKQHNVLSNVNSAFSIDRLNPLTYVLIKPDALVSRSAHNIISVLSHEGFIPVYVETIQFDRFLIRELWRYEYSRAYVERYAFIDKLLTSGPTLFILLKYDASYQAATDQDKLNTKFDASTLLKRRKGKTLIQERAPDSIRAKIGARGGTLNFIHTPDETIDFIRELGVLFDTDQLKRIFSSEFLTKYYSNQLAPLTNEVQSAINQNYTHYPTHALNYSALIEQHGESLAKDIKRFDNKLFLNPSEIIGLLSGRYRLSFWDCIVLINEHIQFNEPGLESVFDFEIPYEEAPIK